MEAAAAASIKKRLGARKGEGYYFPLIFVIFALFDARPFRFAKAEFACNRECPSSLLLEGDPSRSIPECPNSTRRPPTPTVQPEREGVHDNDMCGSPNRRMPFLGKTGIGIGREKYDVDVPSRSGE